MGKRKQDQANIVHGADKVVKKLRAALGKPQTKMAKHIKDSRFGVKLDTKPEVKVLDTNVNVVPTSTGAVLLVNGLALGTSGTDNRIGQKIQMVSANVKMKYWSTSAKLAATTVAPTEMVKVDLVYDKQSNGAAPAWSDIWTDSASVLAPEGQRNLNTIDRFVVLKSWIFRIDSAAAFSEYQDGYISMNHDVRFNTGSTATISDITTGSLFLAYANDNAAANSANSGNLLGNVRISFRDD